MKYLLLLLLLLIGCSRDKREDCIMGAIIGIQELKKAGATKSEGFDSDLVVAKIMARCQEYSE